MSDSCVPKEKSPLPFSWFRTGYFSLYPFSSMNVRFSNLHCIGLRSPSLDTRAIHVQHNMTAGLRNENNDYRIPKFSLTAGFVARLVIVRRPLSTQRIRLSFSSSHSVHIFKSELSPSNFVANQNTVRSRSSTMEFLKKISRWKSLAFLRQRSESELSH
jgi:hypothetical protein